MKLTEIWKEKMIESLTAVYGTKINKDALSTMLDSIIKSKEGQSPNLLMRNIYSGTELCVPLNDIMDVIKKEDLCIEANNTLTYSYRKIESPIPAILIKNKADRNFHKGKAKEYGTQLEIMKDQGIETSGTELDLKFKLEDALEKKIKIFMNSVYGVQGQRGSIIFSPDTAGAVTGQGRNLIAEMMWSIERFLYSTIHFGGFSEFISYLTTIKGAADPSCEFLSYVTYMPTKADVQHIIINRLNRIPNIDARLKGIEISIFHYIDTLTPIERVYVYYTSNLRSLILKNPRVFELFDQIISDPTPFMATGKKTPKQFVPLLKTICDICGAFVIPKMSTPRRVFKYETKRRRGIIISDTDSVIINLHPYVSFLSELHFRKHGHPELITDHVSFVNEEMGFKLVNVMSHLCTHVTAIAGAIFCERGNVPEELRSWIEMKNEFLFKRLIMYTTAKKNYICHTRLREGDYQNKISTTGIKLNSSTMNRVVKKEMVNIIENKILRTQEVDPVDILKDIKNLERFIIDQVKAGDLTFGRKARYSGPNGYKTGIYQSNVGRAAYVWNLLYPSSKINVGDYCYLFDTTLVTERDVQYLKFKDPETYDKLLGLVFKNSKEPELAKHGLSTIALPVSESVATIPSWIIRHIDYAGLTNKHLQPVISLLPSIGIHKSKMSGTKSTYSPIISF